MAKVYFFKKSKSQPEDLKGLERLFDAAALNNLIVKDDIVALKIHFGERGNNAYIKPPFAKCIVDKVKSLGGKPFLTDANTLYPGGRSETSNHIETAIQHGFTYDAIGASVIIADGLRGEDSKKIQVNLKHFKEVIIASHALLSNSMIVLTHFKGHDMTGFGGTLKNLGMGLGTREGKRAMHEDVSSTPALQERIVEYAFGVVKEKRGKIGYINFLTDISPNCDCYPFNDPPIVQDIGFLASLDPVAIDQASIDLVIEAAKEDKFKKLYPDVDWGVQLKYGEEIGLGERKYELERIIV